MLCSPVHSTRCVICDQQWPLVLSLHSDTLLKHTTYLCYAPLFIQQNVWFVTNNGLQSSPFTVTHYWNTLSTCAMPHCSFNKMCDLWPTMAFSPLPSQWHITEMYNLPVLCPLFIQQCVICDQQWPLVLSLHIDTLLKHTTYLCYAPLFIQQDVWFVTNNGL